MKTKIIFLLLIPVLLLSGCHWKNPMHKPSHSAVKNEITARDTLIKPDVKINVNKQYDDKGNIVRFDSSYSCIYSSRGSGNMQMNTDSVYTHFRSFFHHNYKGLSDPWHDNVTGSDSLFRHDFLSNDYFMKRFELNQRMFDNVFRQMDSLKKHQMHRNYPNGETNNKAI